MKKNLELLCVNSVQNIEENRVFRSKLFPELPFPPVFFRTRFDVSKSS
jgi:hypothetical protein